MAASKRESRRWYGSKSKRYELKSKYMKTLKILLLIGCALIIAACNKTANTVSGVYVTAFKNEYSIANDTLIIEAYNLDAGIYKVARRSGYHRIRDGKILRKEFKHESWMSTFDKNKQVLQETAFGRQIYVNADGRSLSFGATYRKIK